MTIAVLLADDHRIVCDGLSRLLDAETDIRAVGQAHEGREAVRLARELDPDVVIMDIHMPGLSGIEATRCITEAGSPAKVIILSMYATVQHIGSALSAGAAGYVLKESAGNEVVEAIRTVYRGGRYISPGIAVSLIDDYLRLLENQGDSHPLDRLSPREREVLRMVVEGKPSAEIASLLGLSPKTVETYRVRLMRKLGIHDLPGLVRFAIQHGLTSLE
jgi:DNA-binding NarL/FixJ family response regulator